MSKTSGASRRSRRSRRVRTLRRTSLPFIETQKRERFTNCCGFSFSVPMVGRADGVRSFRAGRLPLGILSRSQLAPPKPARQPQHARIFIASIVARKSGGGAGGSITAIASPHLFPQRSSEFETNLVSSPSSDFRYSTLLVVFRSRPVPSRPVPSRPRPPHPKSIGRLKLQHNPRTLQSW
jgi:hypothetical protein